MTKMKFSSLTMLENRMFFSKQKNRSRMQIFSGVDVVAPGVNVLTLTMTSSGSYTYDYFTGTSAACPHVAAVAALILSVNPNLTNIEVNDIIESTARKVGSTPYSIVDARPNGTWNEYMGYGLVDASAAIAAALQTLN